MKSGTESHAVVVLIGPRDNTTCGATSTLAAIGGERVRALQHDLYRTAKADPNRGLHALQDKVYRGGVLGVHSSFPP